MYFQKDFQSDEIPSSSHVSCKIYSTSSDGEFELHCHSYYEISVVLSGQRYETCNGAEHLAKKGSLFFYPPLALHSNRNITDVDVMVVQFSSDFLYNNSSREFSNVILSWSNNEIPYIDTANLENISNEINKLVEIADSVPLQNADAVSYEFKKSSTILMLLASLIENDFIKTYKTSDSPMHIPQLDAVINHILAHPEEKNDMETAAKMANMSYYNFSRHFKSVIGFNYSEYCNLLRIRYAEDLLLKTDLPISNIASKIGIDVPSYFTKLFKKLNGISPLDYRKNNKS